MARGSRRWVQVDEGEPIEVAFVDFEAVANRIATRRAHELGAGGDDGDGAARDHLSATGRGLAMLHRHRVQSWGIPMTKYEHVLTMMAKPGFMDGETTNAKSEVERRA
jgi:hypothetical protein